MIRHNDDSDDNAKKAVSFSATKTIWPEAVRGHPDSWPAAVRPGLEPCLTGLATTPAGSGGAIYVLKGLSGQGGS